jgi:hypothetical protein
VAKERVSGPCCQAMELQLVTTALPRTPLLCWYWPLYSDERDGQHTGTAAYMCEKVAPWDCK